MLFAKYSIKALCKMPRNVTRRSIEYLGIVWNAISVIIKVGQFHTVPVTYIKQKKWILVILFVKQQNCKSSFHPMKLTFLFPSYLCILYILNFQLFKSAYFL